LIYSSGELIIPGKYYSFGIPISGQTNRGINFIKINESDGSFLTSKSYCNINEDNHTTFISGVSAFSKLDNGLFKVIYINPSGTQDNSIINISFNQTLNLHSSKVILLPYTSPYIPYRYSINSSGSAAVIFFNGLNSQDGGYLALDSTEQIIQQRKINVTTGYQLFEIFWNNDINLKDNSQLRFFISGKRGSKIDMEEFSTNIYNHNMDCSGNDTIFAQTKDFPLNPSSWSLIQGTNKVPTASPYLINFFPVLIQKEMLCQTVKPFKLDLGTDTVKCNNDTVLLKATTGYINYNWLPNSSIQLITDSLVKVHPPSSQDYSVNAETYWGCIMKDTIRINVNRSPLITLGNDTSICNGSDIVLDAGSGFNNYIWNDVSGNRFKTINQNGQYIVEAIDQENCISKDTFNLISLYPKPAVNIHQKEILCLGQTNILNPGNGFISYLWQDGTVNPTYQVNTQGIYWVTVTDKNNCTNSDTSNILSIAEPPSNFIYTDTIKCAYETIVLKPFTNYSSYLWNDSSTQPKLEVTIPGLYYLKVTDDNGCSGDEQIRVLEKTCPNLIYFPSAFTPNNDGKNDLFKPFITGSFDSYSLEIYNRWGQKIFASSDPQKGWNGIFAGKLQNGDAFVWLCKYKFKGNQHKILKGTFVLVR